MNCEHEGCTAEGMDCYLSCATEGTGGKPDGYYCTDHAPLHGFCPICGDFWGGVSSFEMRGLCDHCHDELDELDDECDFDDDL